MNFIKKLAKRNILALAPFISFCFLVNMAIANELRYQSAPAQLPEKFRDYAPGSLHLVILPITALKNMKKDDVVSFDLPFPVGNQSFVFKKLEKHQNGDVTWIGHAEGYDGAASPTIITIGKGEATGQIATPNGNFSIQTVGGNIWLIDIASTGLPEMSHDHMAPDGNLVESELLAPSPSLHLIVPPIFRVGQAQAIQWQATGFHPKSKATFRFLSNGSPFKNKLAPVKKGRFTWKPTKRQVTNVGTIEMCTVPNKFTVRVCDTANFIVLCKTCPLPPPPDITPPDVSITAPANGTIVSETISVSATASDNAGVAGVQFKLDGVNLGTEDTASPYNTSWDTTGTANGSHVLSAIARDAAGNMTTSAGVMATVNNAPPPPPPLDTQPPSVEITNPSDGATVSGTVTASAFAFDNVGVVGVLFKLDGVNLGTEDTASPYNTSWDTTGTANGSHMLSAIARDAAGNMTSSAVTVTVNNAPPPPPCPSPCIVDVLVYHTPDITITRLNLLNATMNQALTDSGVANKQVRIVHSVSVDYPPTTLNIDALNDLKFGNGPFANVNALRVQHGADLVTFVRSFSLNQVNCGIAYLNGSNGTPLSASNAFSVVSDSGPCLDTIFSHELGHNMGLAHERGVNSPNQGALPYGFGFCVQGVACDIMSSGGGFSTVPMYSNPEIVVNGINLGVPIGQPDEADNRSALNAVWQDIANFMPTTQ